MVASAANRWISELAGLNGRDPLLHYRDLKVGTLDLGSADPEHRKRLLDCEAIPVSRLFPHEPLRSSAMRTARRIRDGVRELAQERGIEAAHLVVGIATWANPYAAHRPSVPVLLRSASIVARDPAETDFVITVAAAAAVNPMLLDAMERQLGLRFTVDDLRDPDGQLRYPGVVERLREFAPAHVVDGFSIAHRAVFGRFAREPLALAADLQELSEALERNDVVAALAGDADAVSALRRAGTNGGRPRQLLLETDPAQRDVVAAIVSGRNVQIVAPPGTGVTQTVAVAAAELVATGRRVLIMSSKRASLCDLRERLDSAGLGDMIADGAHSGDALRTRIATTVATMSSADGAAAPVPETRSPASGAGKVQTYLDVLHRRREPWGTSAHQLMAELSVAPPEVRPECRLDAQALAAMDAERFATLKAKLSEYAQLGGLAAHSADSPWRTAHVPTEKSAEAVREAVRGLAGSTLPALKDMATRAAVEVGLAGPSTPAEALATVDLLTGVAVTRSRFSPQIWDAPIDAFVAATAPRRKRSSGAGGPIARRRLRLLVADLIVPDVDHPDRAALHEQLVAVRDQIATWQEKARDGRRPRTGEHLPAASTVASAIRAQLATLASVDPSTETLVELPFAEALRRVGALNDAESELRSLPRRTLLRRELVEAGLDTLVRELRDGPIASDRAADALNFVWQASLLSVWRDQDAELRSADPAALEAELLAPGETEADRDQAVARAQAGRARMFAALGDDHDGEVSVVASAGGAAMSVRDLVAIAPEVVTAALPVWLSSPLAAPMMMPARQLFDTVIIMDAGLLPPSHAVSGLARATQVVLFHEPGQSPPPVFVTTDGSLDEADGAPAAAAPTALPDVLGSALPTLPLATQHRVRDDRLLRMAVASLYEGRVAMLPAAFEPARLSHELVDPGMSQPDSSEAEVGKVVELILTQARTRPHETLGVVTLSAPHASRIETALRAALIRNPDVAGFLAESRSEPFFVKDVTRVAGDVRDAIILSVGFGRSVDGRVLYRFGALDRPGGERRLATAITRSRERTIVVSCFGADDLSPRRLTTPGGSALREFLAYAASPWQPAGDTHGDPLADAIASRLEAAGASVVRAYGDPNAQVEIAVRHPKRQDRMVLAVETDGGRGGGQFAAWRQDRLRALGWSVHRVWSAAWSMEPDREAARLVRAYKQAVASADAYDWGVAAVEADIVAGLPDDTPSEGSKGKARKPKKRRPRPYVPVGRPISFYATHSLAELAAWIESDGVTRTEDAAVAHLAKDLKVGGGTNRLDSRSEDVLRFAIRLARAGGSPRETRK